MAEYWSVASLSSFPAISGLNQYCLGRRFVSFMNTLWWDRELVSGTGKSSIWSEWWILLHGADAWLSAYPVHTFVFNSILLTGLEFSFTSQDLLCPWHWLLIDFNFIWNCTKVCIASFINSSHLIAGSLEAAYSLNWVHERFGERVEGRPWHFYDK